MTDSRPPAGHSRQDSLSDELSDEPLFNTKPLETFSRKVTATAAHVLNPQADTTLNSHYQAAMTTIHQDLRNPLLQRQVFALSRTSPRDYVRSKLVPNEIQHRALTYLPDDLLRNLPENSSPFSLFQGFQASVPEGSDGRRRRGRHSRHGSKLLEGKDAEDDPKAPPAMKSLRNEKHSLDHRLEMLDIRKNMCATEIREIDSKISSLNNMRKIVLDRLGDLETEEAELEGEVVDVEGKIDDLQEELDDEAALSGQKTPASDEDTQTPRTPDTKTSVPEGDDGALMSASIYSKLPSSKQKRPRPGRRKTTHTLHTHLTSGSSIRQIQAHEDSISAIDFDAPFGTMVTAALDDTVRVWDLNAGHCMGLLEGHLSSVRCLQVEDSLVATGSMDATVRLWDLSQAEYSTPSSASKKPKRRKSRGEGTKSDSDDDLEFADAAEEPPPSNMRDCALHTLNAHVAEVTALHFHNNTLVSGSADKTIRQWDLEKGRCVQTLDVLWAAAQASTSLSTASMPSARSRAMGGDASGDFVGALQCFDAALACGTADGMVRLWDLRSGMVHRSLVGHTDAVTCLRFDDVYLVTGSQDRSIRIWDLRTGSIFDAYAYDNPVTSMSFDTRSIAAAAGESVVKVYDKAEARHWDCGGTVSGEGDAEGGSEGAHSYSQSPIDRVRLRDGYMVGGRRDGSVGVWSV